MVLEMKTHVPSKRIFFIFHFFFLSVGTVFQARPKSNHQIFSRCKVSGLARVDPSLVRHNFVQINSCPVNTEHQLH